MKHATLCIPITDTEILLGRKKVRWGAGKWNGFGGKIEDGETPKEATVRELEEECGLCAHQDNLEKVAVLLFYFNGEPKFLMHTYLVRDWVGETKETDEMIPQWHPLEKVPYDEMWKADSIWLGKVLNREKVAAHIHFKIEGIPGEDEETFDRIEYDESLWKN
ncbi:8-oxo-dGTP diphosphatase [candidate division KSB1 bacterium]